MIDKFILILRHIFMSSEFTGLYTFLLGFIFAFCVGWFEQTCICKPLFCQNSIVNLQYCQSPLPGFMRCYKHEKTLNIFPLLLIFIAFHSSFWGLFYIQNITQFSFLMNQVYYIIHIFLLFFSCDKWWHRTQKENSLRRHFDLILVFQSCHKWKVVFWKGGYSKKNLKKLCF